MSLRMHVLTGLVPLLLLADGAFAAQDEILTTDTAEYCRTLHARVMETAQMHPPPPPIEVLTQEGISMCKDGQTRAGILRLRRALLWERSGGAESAR